MSNTADKVQKARKLAGRVEVTSLFSNNSDYQVVRRGELTGAETHKDSQIVLKSVEDLILEEAGADGKYIKKVKQDKGKVTVTVQEFDTGIPVSDASAINAPTTAAVKTYVDNSIDALDVTISGMAANKTLQTLTETNGIIAAEFQDISIASSQINDKTNAYNGTSEVVVTGKALKAALDTLDVAEVGSDGSYIKKISEENGKISTTVQGFDTSFTNATNTNAPTTLAVKEHVAAEINKLDVTSVGADGSYLKTISETDGKISATSATFDTAISTNSEITAPTTKAVKTYVDNHASNTSGHANATATANGFMSATDKSHHDTMWSVWTADGTDNTLVNKVQEVLTVFNEYPEGTSIVNALAGKSDTDHIHGNITTDGKLGTASRVVVTDSNKNITVSSSITTTELDYLDGVTSNIQTQLDGKVDENAAITGATKCKITYDSKGLVTSGADLSASDIPSLATSKITSGTFADERIASAAAWNAKYDKPTAGIPASDLVDLASNKITSMTSYTKASSVSVITASDSLNSAIGKLEKALDGKAATEHGTHVTAATVKEALGTGTGTSKYLREDGKWVTPPNDNDNNTYKIIVSNTSTSSSDSHVANNTNGNSYIILHDTSINSAAASLNITGYDGISVTNTNNGVIKITGNAATNSTYGVVKSAANRTTTPTLITGETVNNRFYGVELDSNGKMFVNVPWTDSSLGTGHTHEIKLESSTDTADINLDFNSNYKLTAGGEAVIFKMPVYENKTAAANGTEVSLVNTGEKYIWNNKQDAISDLATIRSDASTGATHAASTHARTDATKVEASTTNGNIKIDGTETTVYTHPTGTNPHGTTASDVGLGNVGNFKAVSTVASQGLTDAEKSNARANIGAGTSSFEGYTSSNKLAATLVSEDASHRFVTDDEKSAWNTTLKGEIKDGILTITNM